MSRSLFRQRTATLDELELHVTALPPGRTTHAPHTHPNEEIIIIREGTLEAYQNGKTRRLGPGSVIFEASNDPHNVTNVGDTTAVYHVINWASPGTLRPKPAADAREAVQALYREWSRAVRERGAEGYAAYFAEDAVLLPPDAAPVAGRAAIREWQERTQREATHETRPERVSVDELQTGEAWALHRTTLHGTRVPKAGGAAEPFVMKYFDVLRRKADGGWEFTHRMWNPSR
jgi:uncharacterized protein (TIGR02246 family)